MRSPVRRALSTGVVALLTGVTALLAGCTAETPADVRTTTSAGPAPATSAPGQPATLQIASPAEGATNVTTGADIVFTATNAAKTDVEVVDAAGQPVPGKVHPTLGAWLPDAQLKNSTRYTAKLTVTGTDGKPVTAGTSFTTMAKPAKLAKITSLIEDKQTVGVGMPVVVRFGVEVAKEHRAAVQRRLLVTSDPPQEGGFNWLKADELHFRPKTYWQTGTKLSIRAAFGGLQVDGKWYAERDVSVTATVGRKLLMEVDNATKQLTVTQDGQVIKTAPVSLGKPSSPTASGHFVIMGKNEWEWFDSTTFGVPSDSKGGYRLKVQWPQRLTYDGEYFHSAPWSEKDQGKRNVSHGCTNLSAANADWLYKQTLIGDPVIIKGTEEHVKWSNGWTDWDVSFEEFVKGSAIPYVAPQPSASTSGSPSPSASASAGQ